jgi:hypothetical protein
MLLLCWLGGAHVVRDRKKAAKEQQLADVPAPDIPHHKPQASGRGMLNALGVVLLILFSAAHEALGFLVAAICCGVAAFRAVRMIKWGIEARGVTPPDCVVGQSRRLLGAGIPLLLISLFLFGMAYAFVGSQCGNLWRRG